MIWAISQLLVVLLTFQFTSAETPEERAEKMLQQMNTTEKLNMLHGHKGLYIGNIVGNDRLGIPELHMHDGPQGFRVTETTKPQGSTTAWYAAYVNYITKVNFIPHLGHQR
jgi:beta-glucosidase